MILLGSTGSPFQTLYKSDESGAREVAAPPCDLLPRVCMYAFGAQQRANQDIKQALGEVLTLW